MNSLPPESGGFFHRHGAKLLASAIITVLLIVGLKKGGFRFIPEGGDFAKVKWWTVPVYIGIYAVLTYFRSVRWRYLLLSIGDVPNRRLLSVSCIGFAAILLLPFRIGEVVRPYMLRGSPGHGGKKISMTSATSSIITERVVDGLYLSIILAIALFAVPTLDPLPATIVGLPAVATSRVREGAFGMLALFTSAFSSIAIFYFFQAWAHRMIFATVGRVSTKLAEKLTSLFEKFAGGLSVLGNRKAAWGFFVETSLYWFLTAFGMWVLAWGCGVAHADGTSITIPESFALMGTLSIAVLIPGPPGLLGVFQVGLAAGMTMYFPEKNVAGPGVAFAFILYLSQLAFAVVTGAGFLIGNRKNLRQLEEAEGILEAEA